MGRLFPILVCFLNASILFIQLCGAQLTGNITSPGSLFVVTIAITNPTQQTISILKWNNVFDNSTQLPVSLAIEDDQGTETPIASTYVMRAGMSNSDLYSLAPGQTYEKVLDLRQILQNLGSGGSGLQMRKITMSIPPSFRGIVSTGAPGAIPSEAAADLGTSPIRLGNLATAGLQDITVTSTSFPGTLYFPVFRSADIADPGPADGIQVHSSCAPPNATDSDALFDAGVYAYSLAMAANDTTSTLFTQFFRDSMRQSVGAVAGTAASAIHGGGPHVDLYCTDILDMCGDSNVLGYTFAPSFLGNAYIVLCPVAVALGRAPEPCSTPAGTPMSASTSQILFHLVLTLSNIVPIVMSESIYGSQACQHILSNSTSQGINASPLKNADSYAQLAIAHWGYGLGGQPYAGPSCLPPGGVVPSNQKREQAIRNAKKPRPNLTREVSSTRVRRQEPEDNFLETELAKVGACTGVEKQLVENALANAQTLAALARDAQDPELWTKYFNGGIPVQQRVTANFNKVATWDPAKNPIDFLCDTQRRSAFCASPDYKANMIGILDPRTLALQSESIVFCPNFFYSAPALECLSPSYTNPYMSEQAGGLMHELLHSRSLVNYPAVGDGSPSSGLPFCYDYFCATQYAHDRVLPGFPTTNLPEIVAKNYEFYALAVRAKRRECTWTEYVGSRFGLYGY